MRILLLIVTLTGMNQAQDVRYPDTTFADGTNRVSLYKDFGLTVLSVQRGFDYIFIPKNVPSFLSVAQTRNYRFMINGSYFDGVRLDAQHSGWLRILGKSFAPIWDNRQLTHIVRFNTRSGAIDIVSSKVFKPTNDNQTIEFQTGPLMIDNNKVALSFISHSINGPGKYTRTLIAVSNRNELFFITVRKPVSLEVLARFLLTLSVFQAKRLDVVNLDGGPSVAFYARAFPMLNFNVDDRLPLLLGVH